jgi:MFS family permease
MGVLALLTVALGGGVFVVIGLLLGAIITSVLQTQATALIGDYAGANRQGRLLGILGTAGDIGAAAGPLLAFFLIEHGWSLQNIFVAAAVLIGLMLPGAIWVHWRYGRLVSVTQPIAST